MRDTSSVYLYIYSDLYGTISLKCEFKIKLQEGEELKSNDTEIQNEDP